MVICIYASDLSAAAGMNKYKSREDVATKMVQKELRFIRGEQKEIPREIEAKLNMDWETLVKDVANSTLDTVSNEEDLEPAKKKFKSAVETLPQKKDEVLKEFERVLTRRMHVVKELSKGKAVEVSEEDEFVAPEIKVDTEKQVDRCAKDALKKIKDRKDVEAATKMFEDSLPVYLSDEKKADVMLKFDGAVSRRIGIVEEEKAVNHIALQISGKSEEEVEIVIDAMNNGKKIAENKVSGKIEVVSESLGENQRLLQKEELKHKLHEKVQNAKAFSKRIVLNNGKEIKLYGRVDAIVDDVIIEIKNRRRRLFYEIVEYEKVQCHAYMFLAEKPFMIHRESFKGKSVETKIHFDKDFWKRVLLNVEKYTEIFEDMWNNATI